MSIRTTVTLDEDILDRLREESRKRGESFRETLNAVLRVGLSSHAVVEARKPFKVRPFPPMGPIPGLNYDKVQDLLDYAEGEDRKW